MKTLTPFLLLSLAAASVGAIPAFAATATVAAVAAAVATPSAKADEMTRGEIKKIDLEAGKVTIKHGEIKNLDMPAMTMVFKLTKPAEANNFNVGDNVQFRADNLNGTLVVTEIAAVR
jgi:Cu(I)/Ag(I) efflux system protein CusF